MRLIDADALFKEEREEYRNNAKYISTDYEHIFAEIDDMPTVCDIEQIKKEIRKVMDGERDLSTDNARAQYIALGWCLEIIDKHTK